MTPLQRQMDQMALAEIRSNQLEEYAELVRQMRAVQKRWFGGDKSSATLQESKRLERQVDRATDAILNPPEPTLFDRENP